MQRGCFFLLFLFRKKLDSEIYKTSYIVKPNFLRKQGVDMTWSELFTEGIQPELEQIAAYIGNPLWEQLRYFIEDSYKVSPSVEYSKCSEAKGWNVKYKKSSKSLCTLYPDSGCFTALVTIGKALAEEAELILPSCTDYVQNVYKNAAGLNGARWLMIKVTSKDILDDVKRLIQVRVKPVIIKN